MTFWTYLLHCKGGYFYAGHTDDLDRRMAEHAGGEVAGFVRDHWPAKLVWSSEFPTRQEALTAERQIKGWSRDKKLALIRGDWDRTAALSKGKGRASTSSARTEWMDVGRPSTSSGQTDHDGGNSCGLVSVFLHPHLDHPPSEPFSLEVSIRRSQDRLHLRYGLTGAIGLVRVPPSAPADRADGLWRHSCFEAFARSDGSGYREFNFSPSSQWAAYEFYAYREGMSPLEVEPPVIRCEHDRSSLQLSVELPISVVSQPLLIGLSAVIEEVDGAKSYWALRHPSGPPDFHHPDCFALTLPAPGEA